jgi:mRNA interferase MazF
MNFRLGEVVLIRMQFHQHAGAKIRPAIVLLDTGDDDFVAAPVTSRFRPSEFDLEIVEWRAAGLNAASIIRIHKLTVLAKSDIARVIGRVTEEDGAQLARLLCAVFCREPESILER